MSDRRVEIVNETSGERFAVTQDNFNEHKGDLYEGFKIDRWGDGSEYVESAPPPPEESLPEFQVQQAQTEALHTMENHEPFREGPQPEEAESDTEPSRRRRR